ncbi:MAG: hypothetical protein F4053_08045 [Proteobacteria bacterium]|nr:hypothetical protein [Pseudomonadota bacterium]
MPKRPNIAEAMRDAGGSTRARPVVSDDSVAQSVATKAAKKNEQPRRAGTKAVTGHYPPVVRYQLKLLAAEQGRTMEDMLAEGLNLLFASYGKSEIAPRAKDTSD